MFGKIKYISDNTAVVEINKDGNLVSNLMNLHVVFESNGDKLLGEVKNVDENSVKIELLGEFAGTRFIAGTIKKPTLTSTLRVINEEELDIIYICQKIAFDELGLKSIVELYDEPKMLKRFYNIVNNLVKQKLNYKCVYDVYKIRCNIEYLDKGLEENLTSLALDLDIFNERND